MESLKLERLGRAVADVSEALDATEDGAKVQAELLRRLHESEAKSGAQRRLPKYALLAAAFSACLVLLSLGLSRGSARPIHFSQGGERGAERTWMAPGKVPKTLAFSDGSRVELFPESRARVNTLSAQGAELLLERGSVEAAVVPRNDANWLLLAGPYSVRVTGTRFKLSWSPEIGELVLQMSEGSVVVDGPRLDQPRVVVGGQELRISVAQHAHEPPKVAEDAGPGPLVEEPASETTRSSGPEPVDRTDPVDPEFSARDRVAELLAQADAARLAGNGELARDVLLEAREKHAVRSNTAYLLGKVSADQLNNTSEAARWFETYLREQPAGRLREQALGRLLTLRHGSRAVVEQRARTYLADYPSGAYAPLAHRLLEPGAGL